jgi:hypothetical protein
MDALEDGEASSADEEADRTPSPDIKDDPFRS